MQFLMFLLPSIGLRLDNVNDQQLILTVSLVFMHKPEKSKFFISQHTIKIILNFDEFVRLEHSFELILNSKILLYCHLKVKNLVSILFYTSK
jgi:hypothetical protein